MRFIFTLLLVFNTFFLLLAQESGGSNNIFSIVATPANGGKVTVVQDSKITELINFHLESNKRSETMEGFRIQIYSGSSKKAKGESMAAKSLLLSNFPNTAVYLEYKAPFWRVRAGDFRSKNEAMELNNRLKSLFPDCYPVKDPQIYFHQLMPPLEEVVAN